MMNGARRALFLFFATLITFALAHARPAWAKDPKAPLAIVVEGAGADKVRAELATVLPDPWVAADAKAVAAATKQRKLPAGTALDDPSTKAPYLQTLAQIIGDVGAKAAVVVRVSKGKKREARVALVSSSGNAVAEKEVPLTAPDEDAFLVIRSISGDLPAALRDEPPPKPQPAPAPSPTEPSQPQAEAPKPSAPAQGDSANKTPPPATSTLEPPPWLVAAAAIQFANRSLSYRDAASRNISSDDSGVVPGAAIAIDLFPLAREGAGFIRDLGLFGDFAFGLVQDKAFTDGTKASASWTRFDVGLKYRLWFARDWSSTMIALSASYGHESFSYGDGGPPQPLDTPSATYKILRPRAEARIPIGPIAVLPAAGFLAVVDAGEVASKFRDSSVLGWEAELAVGVPIIKLLEVQAGVGYRRMIYRFKPIEGDAFVANGAIDQLLRVNVGVATHL